MKTLLVTQVFNSNFQPGTDHPDSKDRYVYEVVKVTNSTTPKIGARLTVDELHGYCENADWNVTIK
jgi:hypothetical protein